VSGSDLFWLKLGNRFAVNASMGGILNAVTIRGERVNRMFYGSGAAVYSKKRGLEKVWLGVRTVGVFLLLRTLMIMMVMVKACVSVFFKRLTKIHCLRLQPYALF